MDATFASELPCLQAEISELQLKAKATLEQQRAKLVYSAAVKSFCQLADTCSSSIRYALPDPSYFWLAMQVWQERYPGVSPQARTSDYGLATQVVRSVDRGCS